MNSQSRRPAAKPDGIDAAVLAHFAEVMKPELRRLPDPETRKLRALITRRNQSNG